MQGWERYRDGKIKWMHKTYQKVPGKEGKPDVYNGIIYEVTERKETEENLAKVEIARKKEVHHRIKNNLQVISSMLDFQAENLEDERTKEILRESRNRIMSIAFIHKELYRNRKLSNVDLSTYLRVLAENLLDAYEIRDFRINLYIWKLKRNFFDIDTAVPLGIIINEIFSNSLKYAFPDRKSGEIRIRLVREKERGLERNNWSKRKNQGFKGNASFILTVSDNGVGIPETFDLEKSESLGLKLIRVLADQLDENVRLNRNNGTEYIIKFAAGPA